MTQFAQCTMFYKFRNPEREVWSGLKLAVGRHRLVVLIAALLFFVTYVINYIVYVLFCILT
jgi:hypothetical protein